MFPLLLLPELILPLLDGDILQEVSISLAPRTLKAQLVEEWHDLQHNAHRLMHQTSWCVLSMRQEGDIPQQ